MFNQVDLALNYCTPFCCDCLCHWTEGQLIFDLNAFLPQKLFVRDPPLAPDAVKLKKTRNVYRPTAKCPFLEFRVVKWLEYEHSIDPLRSVQPPHLILSQQQQAILVRTHPDKIKTKEDICHILEESTEWANEWASKIYQIIKKFEGDYSRSTEKQAGKK